MISAAVSVLFVAVACAVALALMDSVLKFYHAVKSLRTVQVDAAPTCGIVVEPVRRASAQRRSAAARVAKQTGRSGVRSAAA